MQIKSTVLAWRIGRRDSQYSLLDRLFLPCDSREVAENILVYIAAFTNVKQILLGATCRRWSYDRSIRDLGRLIRMLPLRVLVWTSN